MKNNDEYGLNPITDNLPKGLKDRTIAEIMNTKDSELHYKNGKLSVRSKGNGYVATLEISQFETGRHTTSFSSVPDKSCKKDFKQDIIEMKSQGMKQKDIAFQLGISPAYVSRILREK